MITRDSPTTPRHAMPEFEDYPDDHATNVHVVYARVTGGMQLPMPAIPGAHRAVEPGDADPKAVA